MFALDMPYRKSDQPGIDVNVGSDSKLARRTGGDDASTVGSEHGTGSWARVKSLTNVHVPI